MDNPEKFYITTPIYYVNARPHIGHTYTTVVCDAIARRQRMMGADTWFLTGTDEHGQKIERSAAAAGCSPREFVDRIAGEFRALWDRMGITYNDFIRTTEPRHVRGVQALFTRLQERGYIYKGSYSGQYCVFDELYVDAVGTGAPCPECGRPTETVHEENYFFKLSAMEQRLLKYYAEHPDFIRPETRRNEVIAFVRSGLRDLSVSRTSFKWGIPVPGDPKHVIYVWLDALANYMTAIGFGSSTATRRPRRVATRTARSAAVALALPQAGLASATARIWMMAARLRTLPAAIAPCWSAPRLRSATVTSKRSPSSGTARRDVHPGRHELSNDYSDARRGADTEDRLGPVRVTAGGLVPPGQVLTATYVTFGLACACGIYLIAVAGWELLAVGAASILAGVLYTGGPRPYGYEGLGELFVFLFFGIVAVTGSYFVQVQQLPWQAFVCAVPVGLLASAILVVNNVRDLETDRRAGKRTLAVRLGRERTRVLYAAMLAGAFLFAPLPWLLGSMEGWLLLPWLTIPLALALIRVVRTRTDGPALNGALARTGLLQLLFCLLFSTGILASGGIPS